MRPYKQISGCVRRSGQPVVLKFFWQEAEKGRRRWQFFRIFLSETSINYKFTSCQGGRPLFQCIDGTKNRPLSMQFMSDELSKAPS